MVVWPGSVAVTMSGDRRGDRSEEGSDSLQVTVAVASRWQQVFSQLTPVWRRAEKEGWPLAVTGSLVRGRGVADLLGSGLGRRKA